MLFKSNTLANLCPKAQEKLNIIFSLINIVIAGRLGKWVS